jgi:hypothetical protein
MNSLFTEAKNGYLLSGIAKKGDCGINLNY